VAAILSVQNAYGQDVFELYALACCPLSVGLPSTKTESALLNENVLRFKFTNKDFVRDGRKWPGVPKSDSQVYSIVVGRFAV
jgi:hypothetical protein